MDREARVSVGPRRNHDGGHQDKVRGGARALPLPRVRLDRRRHHGGVSADRALAAVDKRQRSRTVSCSGSFFYPELAGRRGPRPPGWQPALADAGVDFSALPTDRPVNFDNIERAPQRRAGGGLRLRVAADPVDGRAGVLPRPQQRAPSGTGVVRHTVLLLLHT